MHFNVDSNITPTPNDIPGPKFFKMVRKMTGTTNLPALRHWLKLYEIKETNGKETSWIVLLDVEFDLRLKSIPFLASYRILD